MFNYIRALIKYIDTYTHNNSNTISVGGLEIATVIAVNTAERANGNVEL